MSLPELGIPILIGAGGFAALLVFTAIAKKFLYICKPNHVLIFSGRRHRLPDGTTRGFRVIFGGRGWRVPFIEEVHRMSLNLMEVRIATRNAYSKGAIALNVDAIANVKLSSDPGHIGNAIERFLGRDPSEIALVAKETLEGHVRGVLATLTPEEINEDRLKFAEELKRESEEDLEKLGIHLDTLKIQHVADEASYLDSIGRGAIARVIKEAEMAESDAKRDAEQAEAENAGRANVINANVNAVVAQMQNELRRIKAELDSRINSEEARTIASAREERAKAEHELQEVRVELEGLRLEADQVLPADANRKALELQAQGQAATIRERSKALGEALDAMHQAWADAGDAALVISVIEDLEKHMQVAARGVAKVKIDKLNLIDSGDGKTLSAYIAAYPAMLASIFESVARTTGIDIPELISGHKPNNGAPSVAKGGSFPAPPIARQP